MKLVFRQSFTRDTRAIHDGKLLRRLEQVIIQAEKADKLADLMGVQAMQGHSNCFRVRVGAYRVGLFRSGDALEFVRFLHRREIYRYFP